MQLPAEKIQSASCDSIFARDLFDTLAALRQTELGPTKKQIHFLPAVTVFQSGEKPDGIYVHNLGRAMVLDDGIRSVSAEAYASDASRVYGLIEVLSESTFNMSLRTITECEFDIISGEELVRFVLADPALTFRIATLIARLHQETLKEIRDHGKE